jgi:hypothetical protein
MVMTLKFFRTVLLLSLLVTDKDEHIADWRVAERKTGIANLLGHVWTGKLWQQVNWGSKLMACGLCH